MSKGTADKSRSESINLWTQTIGIVVAGIWAGYTFVFKEWYEPRTAPVNISLNLAVKRLAIGSVVGTGTTKGFTPLEISMEATNPSTREIYLFNSLWYAIGTRLRKATDDHFTTATVSQSLQSLGPINLQPYFQSQSVQLVAAGRIFADQVLKPNEVIRQNMIFYVPDGKFDEVEVSTLIPDAAKGKRDVVRWQFDFDNCVVTPQVDRLAPNGKNLGPIKANELGVVEDKDSDLEMAFANQSVAL